VQSWLNWAGKLPQGTTINNNVQLSVVSVNAGTQTHYVSVKFSGGIILQQNEYAEIQLRFNKSDWSAMTQSNDWSFTNSQNWQVWTKATGYSSGSLVWGQEPASTALPATVSSVITYPNPATSDTGVTLGYSIATTGTGVTAGAYNEQVYAIDPSARLSLKIFSQSGRLIWQQDLDGVYYLTTGEHQVKWDGKVAGGKELSAGMYTLKVELKMKDGTSTGFARIIMLR